MSENKITRQELYEKEQITRMKEMVVGAKDSAGHTISKVYAKGEEYIIYEVAGLPSLESMKIRIYTKKANDMGPLNRYQEVKDEFDRFKSTFYKTGADNSYKQRAAHALSVAINGNVDKSSELFEKIICDAKSEYRDRLIGRLFYLGGSLLMALIMAIAAILAYLNRHGSFVVNNFALVEFVYAAAFAAFGGLFSISYKSKNLDLERALNSFMYAVFGAERLIFSILGGVFSVTLIKGDVAIGFISTQGNGIYGMLVICFLAGFSETLIPNTLNKLESDSNNSNK